GRFPDVRYVQHASGASWLARVLAELKAEAENGGPGASAIVTKLADVFLAQAFRDWLLDGSGVGLADPRRILDEPIAKAVQALNDRSTETWSVDELARHVGLSRTALATKFRERVGEPPVRYLADRRMRRAAEELQAGRLTLHEVARRADYASDAAFAKAFKRRFGMAPGVYRGTAGEPPLIGLTAIR